MSTQACVQARKQLKIKGFCLVGGKSEQGQAMARAFCTEDSVPSGSDKDLSRNVWKNDSALPCSHNPVPTTMFPQPSL